MSSVSNDHDDRERRIARAVADVLDENDPAACRLIEALIGVIRGLREPKGAESEPES
jgi:hypothetical protein